MTGLIDDTDPREPSLTAAAARAFTEDDDPACPKIDVIYDGDEPWSYGARAFVKGEPLAIAALNAKSLVLTYPTRFRFANEVRAIETLQAHADQQAAAHKEAEAMRRASTNDTAADTAARTLEDAARIAHAVELRKLLGE